MKTLGFKEIMTMDAVADVVHEGVIYTKMSDGAWWKEDGLEEDVTLDEWDPLADEENVRYTLVESKNLIAILDAIE